MTPAGIYVLCVAVSFAAYVVAFAAALLHERPHR